MPGLRLLRRSLFLCALPAAFASAQSDSLSNERIAAFLETARVVRAHAVGKGSTETWRLTLADGEMAHDASFQSIDERAPMKDFGGGRYEVHFVDSYRYNIAAYRLAGLLGVDDMVPVSVERTWRTKTGAFTWWVDDVRMDENEMEARRLTPPDAGAWNHQIYKVRVFSQLVYDTDRNRGNNLITRAWRVWMIDFTRAFRRWPKLRSTEDLHRCSRDLYEKLQSLSAESLGRQMGDALSEVEIEGLLARRDLLVAHFSRLARERGESAVFY